VYEANTLTAHAAQQLRAAASTTDAVTQRYMFDLSMIVRSISAEILHSENPTLTRTEEFLKELQSWSESLPNTLSDQVESMALDDPTGSVYGTVERIQSAKVCSQKAAASHIIRN
jgi:hypothetical protein